MKIRDFSTQKRFPGTTGNPFDVVLHGLLRLEKIPALFFGLLLALLAVLVGLGSWQRSLTLAGFFLLDWSMLAGLPAAGRSFGPAKPVVLMLALPRILVSFLPLPFSLIVQVLGTLLLIYGFWIEPHRLTLTRQVLATASLPDGFQLRVLHLGDLHIERITRRELDLNRMINSLAPDLILFSGDFLNLSYLHDPAAWQAVRTILAGWQAPLGVYAVTGSPAVDLADVIPGLLDGLPLTLLDEDVCVLHHQGQAFELVGLSCSHNPAEDAPRLARLLSDRPDRFRILLYHSPDLAPNAAHLDLDLQLSGHTHGGQVRLPVYGALFTGTLYGKTLEAGRLAIGSLTLYITRGIGLEGAAAPRVRFLCPPEIILWEIDGVGATT